MSGIAGINKPEQYEIVNQMLDKMQHRGNKVRQVFSTRNSTFGIVSNFHSQSDIERFKISNVVQHNLYDILFAKATEVNGKIQLERDYSGVVPLYYTKLNDSIYFSSEIKALKIFNDEIFEIPPGSVVLDNQINIKREIELPSKFLNDSPEAIAKTLRSKIENAVIKRINKDTFGSWLSGGIDSSIIVGIARPHIKKFFTFTGGLKNSTDVEYSRLMANYIKSNHIEIIVDLNDILKNLSDVIYHLESFDAYLVRSTILNFIISRKAKDYVEDIFSGEGSDELFAGYEYLKTIPMDELPAELINITKALANTALQRVDRSSFGNGLIPHVPFMDPEVFEYALKIPPQFKINNGIEKWILRQSAMDILPEKISNRGKEKFWQGSGLKELLYDYANAKITDSDFNLNRTLKNGFKLRSKEEYLYYKIFEEHFGEFKNFDWLGFTKINNST